jgi:hypothetical protein
MRRIALFLILLVAGTLLFQDLLAQPGSKPAFGAAIKVSTNGPGGDLVYRYNEKVGFRLGFDRLGFKRAFTFEENAVDYAADLQLRTGGLALLADYYLASKVFISAGAAWNLFSAKISGHAAGPLQFGDIQIPADKIGSFDFVIKPSWKVSPYLGIGFGRTLNFGKRVGFAFELGAFYQGPPDIAIASDKLLSPTSNPDHRQSEKLERQISQYSVYPVMKFSLSYRITSKF